MKLSYKKIALLIIISCYFLLGNRVGAENYERSLIVFGDSLVAGYKLPIEEAFPAVLERALAKGGIKLKVINAGVSGDTTSGGLARLEWNLEEKPDFAILELGANDMLRGIDTNITYNNLEAMLKIFKKKRIPVLLAGMRARPNFGWFFVDKYQKIYNELENNYDILYYPFFLKGVITKQNLLLNDGMHPNSEGVKIIVKNILPLVKKLIGED